MKLLFIVMCLEMKAKERTNTPCTGWSLYIDLTSYNLCACCVLRKTRRPTLGLAKRNEAGVYSALMGT